MKKDKRYVVPAEAFKHFLELIERKQQAEQVVEDIDQQAGALFNTYRAFLDVPEGYILNMDGEFTPSATVSGGGIEDSNAAISSVISEEKSHDL